MLKNQNGVNLTDQIYPIGSIYISVNSNNPSSYFGGEWESFGKGRTIVGIDPNQEEFNTVQKTGGEKTRKLGACIGAVSSNIGAIGYQTANPITGINTYNMRVDGNAVGGGGHTVNHSTPVYDRDTGQDVSVVQPYITCYMWKRTA